MPKGEHTRLGIASLVLGIIAIITCIVGILFPFYVALSIKARTVFSVCVISIPIFGALSLILGVESYWGKRRDSYGRTGIKLSLISIFVDILMWIWIFIVASLLSY